jgi:hypothetical protein
MLPFPQAHMRLATWGNSHELAGAEGFEPPSSVLETDSLTVELTPLKFTAVKPLKCCNSATPKRQRPPCREGILTDVVSQRVVLRSQRQQKKSVLLPTNAELFCLFVRGMLAATIAKLGELKPAGGRLFVLRGRVIALFAFRTLEGNYFTH